MRYQVTHITDYNYEFPATLCHNVMYQTPLEMSFQRVINYDLSITPTPDFLVNRSDFFGNQYGYFSLEKLHQKLVVKSRFEVDLEMPAWRGIDPATTQPWEEVAAWLQTTDALNDIRQFYLESPHIMFISGVREYALASFWPGRPIMEAMLELNSRIHADFKFTPGFTDISTPLQKVFDSRKGVCQDFAHFSLACLRSIGLSAKYMSGYIETLPPPGKPKLVGADASHAWIALYIPGLYWVEFDATNNLLVGDQHIRVASGRDFSDVTPLKGIVYSNGKQSMKVSVDVRKVENNLS